MRFRFRRTLHKLVEYDAITRRKRSLALFFLIGLGMIIGLAFIGIDSSGAADLWLFLLIRFVIGFVIACLILPIIWLLRRRLKLPKTPAAFLFLALTLGLTLLVVYVMARLA
ncbi:MAG TPA: hypothetical protein VGB18_09315 [Candidatus Thermoplasmatota archaeon]